MTNTQTLPPTTLVDIDPNVTQWHQGHRLGAVNNPYSYVRGTNDVESVPTDTRSNKGGGNVGLSPQWDMIAPPCPPMFGPTRADVNRVITRSNDAAVRRHNGSSDSGINAFLSDMLDVSLASESMGPWSDGDVLSSPLKERPADLLETLNVWQCPSHGDSIPTYRDPSPCCPSAVQWSATVVASLDRKSYGRGSASAFRTAATVATDTTLGRIAPKGGQVATPRTPVPNAQGRQGAMVAYSAPLGTVTLIDGTNKSGRPVQRPKVGPVDIGAAMADGAQRETMILTSTGTVPKTLKGQTGKVTPLTGAERTRASRARKASAPVATVDAELLATRAAAAAAAARKARRASRLSV